MLAVLYGVNEIIILTTISFPASVTCMLLLYFTLIILTRYLGEKKVAKVVKLVEIPGGFSLRWINIFFTPAFITLPLSAWISAKEALTIAAVFVFGYLIATGTIAYFTIFLQLVLKKGRRSNVERGEELDPNQANNESLDGSSTTTLNLQRTHNDNTNNEDHHHRQDSIEPFLEFDDLDRVKSLDDVPRNIIIDIPNGDANEIEERYIKRLNSHHHYEEDDTAPPYPEIDAALLSQASSSSKNTVEIHISSDRGKKVLQIPSMPSPTASPNRALNPGVDVEFNEENKLFCKRAVMEQYSPLTDGDLRVKVAHLVRDHFDYMVFTILFIVSIPIYFAAEYEMPLQLSISIFTFLFMLRVPPPRYKRFLHPVLCSVGLSWLFYYLFALMKGENFLDSLRQYKTSRTYLNLFRRSYSSVNPGAGDVFSTLMDVSIVSLSIPMYTYRRDLRKHLTEIFLPILVMSLGCFFIYPPMCHQLGISPERSLGFAGRSITLALGTPFVKALDGSESLMAVTTVVSGIIGALTCQPLFKFMRIREDDYVTRGITLGVNCGAIATAHLLTVDPRAAAMSSLSFVLFGTIMVIMASITPLAHVIKAWAGM